MAITKEKKQNIVSELTNSLKDSASIVFVNFHKLTVKDANAIRSSLRSEGVGYKVSKKTLLGRVLDTKGITGEMPVLDGEIAIAYGTDLIAPARGIFEFQKTHKDSVKIVGGVFEGRYLSASEMMAIATIPDIKSLRGMFVNIINSPIQRFVIALDQIAGTKA